MLILVGLFKKVVIADGLAPFVNDTFSQPDRRGSVTLVLGVYAFALQILCDFSGYSDIARGSSRLLGIELPVNFAQPYLSPNVTTFWRRWHISLSNWLRDYLYIPLGGNRGGRTATYRNLILTMLLGGLWHGAAAKFVIWGGLHGLFLAAERAWGVRPADGKPNGRDLPRILLTFHLVCLAWVFFRAASFGAAVDYLQGILVFRSGWPTGDNSLWLAVAAILVVLFELNQRRQNEQEAALRWPALSRGLAYGAMATLILIFSGGTPVPFIYFQF